MDLPKDHLKNVCKIGQGEATCSFLAFGADGWSCLKGTALEGAIRERRANGTINAKGDNCSGQPHFQNTKEN